MIFIISKVFCSWIPLSSFLEGVALRTIDYIVLVNIKSKGDVHLNSDLNQTSIFGNTCVSDMLSRERM